LSEEAAKLWKQLATEIDLEAGGAMMLTVLAQTWDRRNEARAAIAKHGAVFTDRFSQQKPSPWIAIERDATLALQRSFHSLGLDLQDSRGGEPDD